MGTLVLVSSFRPELTTKSLRLCEHCIWYETFGCGNDYFLSEFSVSGKESSSFSVPSKVVPGLIDSNVYLYGSMLQCVLNCSELYTFVCLMPNKFY